jgi:hypothetical protein
MKLLGGLSLLVGYQAQTFLVLEDLEAAAAAAAQAHGLARHHGERGYEAMALRLVGEAALARGEAGAEPTLDEARALAEALAMRPLLAECHAALAVACERRAEATAAAAPRAAARAIVAATGMHPIA